MNERLESIFQNLEKQREKILNDVSKLDREGYQRSVNGKWSIAQILTHILTSEKLSVGYMKKKSLAVDSLGNSGWIESLKYTLLRFSQRIPMRYKAPMVVVQHTPDALSYEMLNHQWNESRMDLKKFLEKITDKNLLKKIYKHPVAGRLNVMQAILFFQDHIHHHLPQINRLLK